MKTLVPDGTRERVASLLLERGPLTATALAATLRITSTAVRRHLDALVGEGSASEAEEPHTGRRGRPAKTYSLTDAGRERFPQQYDDLALAALRFLSDATGEDGVRAFARARVADLETRYAAIKRAPARRRSALLAAALSEDGYAATVEAGAVCQHHCPVQHVAEEFPQLCEAETEAFSRLLGTPVLRLTTIAHGESCCTAVAQEGRSL